MKLNIKDYETTTLTKEAAVKLCSETIQHCSEELLECCDILNAHRDDYKDNDLYAVMFETLSSILVSKSIEAFDNEDSSLELQIDNVDDMIAIAKIDEALNR